MEGERPNLSNPAIMPSSSIQPVNPGSSATRAFDPKVLLYRQWHTIPLLPEGPQFIEEIYKAKGLTKSVVEIARNQMERILQSRPTVKPLMKRRGLPSKAVKTPEETPAKSLPVLEPSAPVMKPSLPVLEPSLPVLEPSSPVSSETITVYSVIPDTSLVTSHADAINRQNCSTPPSKATKVNPQSSCTSKLATPLTINGNTPPPISISNASPSMANRPSTSLHSRVSFSGTIISATNVSSAFRNIFDPDTSSHICQKSSPTVSKSPIKSPIAKKSTGPRIRDKISFLKLKHDIKECKVLLYDYAKDYGKLIKYGEWPPNSSSGEKTEVEISTNKKKEKRRKKDTNQKKKREVPKNGDQPLAKKVKASHDSEKPVQTNSVPKVRIVLKNKLCDPVGISTLLENVQNKDCNSFSNKENIDDLGSSCRTEVEPKQAWKRSAPSPSPPGKKVDIKSVCSTGTVQTEELCKSDKALVIRIPQTSSSADKVDSSTKNLLEKEKSSKKPQLASTITAKLQPIIASKPPSSSDLAVSAPVANSKLDGQKSKDPVSVSHSTLRSTQTLTKAKKKPVISLKAYQSRRSSSSSGDGKNSSSPPYPGTDSVNGSSGHSSPSSTPEDNEPSLSHRLKLHTHNEAVTSKDSTPSPKSNEITSSVQSNCLKPQLKHKLVHASTSLESPKKTKASAHDGLAPIAGSAKNELNDELQSPPVPVRPALKFSLVSHQIQHRADPRRKLLLSTLVENNNNSACGGFEKTTSLVVDSTATAELDLSSNKLHPLTVMYGQNAQPKLNLIKWDTYYCLCDGKLAFNDYSEWSKHFRSCKKISCTYETADDKII
ncbi:hypothetical protein GE061_018461 [Apolygus lucorum]|uniref:Uncharacterized protein n=1 Tax=Apolygus lucorum TaxID=248454 RepID=A0A8S9XG01_APOLU|nr:hypothetical protein GE061_018461 [Apolygus lucorum]